MKLRYAAAARIQIASIHGYIAEHNPVAATVIVGRIRAAAERLTMYPRMGRTGLVTGTFEWVVGGLPYIIVYELPDDDSDTITILNVFHGAQDRTTAGRMA